MSDPGHRNSVRRRRRPGFRRNLCCSFVRPRSPEHRTTRQPSKPPKSDPLQKPSNCYPDSPSPSNKIGLVGRMDPRRILSPGRVSPIDSDAPLESLPENTTDIAGESELEPESVPLPAPVESRLLPSRSCSASVMVRTKTISEGFDVRLDLKGRDGGSLVLELDSEVLCRNSAFFAAKIGEWRRRPRGEGCCLIEVGDVGDLGVFRETIELMFETDVVSHLIMVGVSRSIDILEVSSVIMFDVGIKSCLKYLEAVPWSENEEEKLKILFTRCTFDESMAQDILARLYSRDSVSSQPLAVRLLQSVTKGSDLNARRELKPFVKGLLSASSVYQKNPAGLNKEALYGICNSCVHLLVHVFEEACNSVPKDRVATSSEAKKPLLERISKQVDNLSWLLEILLDKQMAEEFVGLWANQGELCRMHEKASPMVRYELSRISAHVFIALGRGKLQCHGEERYRVVRTWFGPMLVDFGWLQRCSKGLDLRELEEAMGQALLTLTLKQQQSLFLEWFGCFSRIGTECPNLSRAFQIWWRRSFLRSMDAHSHRL